MLDLAPPACRVRGAPLIISLAFLMLQVLTLVVGRWLLGFVFSKHDLDLLDDPIPDSLYCKPCRSKEPRVIRPDLESKGSQDTLSNITHLFTDDDIDGTVTSEPLHMNGNCTRGGADGIVRQQEREESFNLTHEVDQCDLWKNMVKNLDAPLPSPQSMAVRGEGGRGGGGEHVWTVNEVGALDTLEECDTDLESCPVSATLDLGRESDHEFMDCIKETSTLQRSSPAHSTSPRVIRQRAYEIPDNNDSDGEKVNGATDSPILLHYRATPV